MSKNRDRGDDLIAPAWLLYLLLVVALYIFVFAVWKGFA